MGFFSWGSSFRTLNYLVKCDGTQSRIKMQVGGDWLFTVDCEYIMGRCSRKYSRCGQLHYKKQWEQVSGPKINRVRLWSGGTSSMHLLCNSRYFVEVGPQYDQKAQVLTFDIPDRPLSTLLRPQRPTLDDQESECCLSLCL